MSSRGSGRLAVTLAALVAVAALVLVAVPPTFEALDGSSDTGATAGDVVPPRTRPDAGEPGTTTTELARARSGHAAHRATVTGDGIAVHTGPDASTPVSHELPAANEHGIPQTFLVDGERLDPAGDRWYRVLLPVPPNGSTGWIRADDVLVQAVDYRLRVFLSDFRLELWHGDRLARTFPIGVGTDQTPTPGGKYYVKEVFELTRTDSAYGNYAFGLNGYSNVLTEWRGGGIIGIHGTNRPDSIGTKASHGCIRLRNDDMAALASVVVRGTPVAILA